MRIWTQNPFVIFLALGLLMLSVRNSEAETPHKLSDHPKKIIEANVEIVQSAPSAPYLRMSLRAFLADRLGGKVFHSRVNWAGRSGDHEPVISKGRVWKNIGTVKYLTFHHSAGIPNEHSAKMIRNIYTGHVSTNGPLGGSADVGYHFFIDRNGEVWEGRDATKVGTHVGSTPPGLNNEGNIGICGLGTFMNEAPTKAMQDRFIELSRYLSEYYGRRLVVRGHRDWTGINRFAINKQIDCPGKLESVVEKTRRVIAGLDLETDSMIAAATPSDPVDPAALALHLHDHDHE